METSGVEIDVPFLVVVLEDLTEGGNGRWCVSWPDSWREKIAFVKMRRCREKFKGIRFRHDHEMNFVFGLLVTTQLQSTIYRPASICLVILDVKIMHLGAT